MDYTQQPNFYFSNNLNNGFEANQKKTSRDFYSSSSNAALFQMMPTPMSTNELVSTNLHLSYGNGNKNIEEDLSSIINQQTIDLDQFLSAQWEELRRMLVEIQATNYRMLMMAAEEWLLKQIRELDLEINLAVKRTTELEIRLARAQKEQLTWHARVLSEKEKVVSLQAQMDQAKLVTTVWNMFGPEVEDRCSVYEDPKRVEVAGIPDWSCRVCGAWDASVVVLPCRHLCICELCDIAFDTLETVYCPVCDVVRTGSMQVLFS